MTDRQILQLLYIRLKRVNEAIRLLEGYQSVNNRRARAVPGRRRSGLVRSDLRNKRHQVRRHLHRQTPIAASVKMLIHMATSASIPPSKRR